MAISIDVKYQSPFGDYAQKKEFAQYMLANQVRGDSEPFVPKKRGDLRAAVTVSSDNTELIYNMNYARRHYFVYSSKGFNYTTPGTGPRWDRKAAAQHGNKWGKVYARGLGYY